MSYFKGKNFCGRNFCVFANFQQNRESLIPRKISKAVIRESLLQQKMPEEVIRKSLFLQKNSNFVFIYIFAQSYTVFSMNSFKFFSQNAFSFLAQIWYYIHCISY